MGEERTDDLNPEADGLVGPPPAPSFLNGTTAGEPVHAGPCEECEAANRQVLIGAGVLGAVFGAALAWFLITRARAE